MNEPDILSGEIESEVVFVSPETVSEPESEIDADDVGVADADGVSLAFVDVSESETVRDSVPETDGEPEIVAENESVGVR